MGFVQKSPVYKILVFFMNWLSTVHWTNSGQEERMKTDCNENVSPRISLASELLSRLPQSFDTCTKVLMVVQNAFTEISSQQISV